jgi:hypothetical protein
LTCQAELLLAAAAGLEAKMMRCYMALVLIRVLLLAAALLLLIHQQQQQQAVKVQQQQWWMLRVQLCGTALRLYCNASRQQKQALAANPSSSNVFA